MYGTNPSPKNKPPSGSPKQPCRHEYIFLYSEYERIEGPGLNNYKKIDVFYCNKCIDYRRVIAREANERYRPEWYKG